MLAVRFLTLTPLGWGANFNNPGELRTGALPDDFPEGSIRFLEIDNTHKVAKFSPSITLPLGPSRARSAWRRPRIATSSAGSAPAS